MKFCLWIAALLLVVVGTNADFDLDLSDALGPDTTDAPRVPENPKAGPSDGELDLMDAFGLDPEPETEKPKKPSSGGGGELDLLDAFGLDPEPEKPKKPTTGGSDNGGFDLFDALGPDPEPEKPKKPTTGGGDDGGFDLGDALGPDPNPKPAVPPSTGGGGGGGAGGGAGGGFDDSDLWDDSKGELKPEGGGDQDPYNGGGGADQPQEAGAGQIAGIASAVGMAILGAASSYVAYQKKKLCFKIQGGVDPESGKNYEGERGQPQQPNSGGNPLSVLTNLLRTS